MGPGGQAGGGVCGLARTIWFWGSAFFPDSKTFLAPTAPEGAVVRWDAATVQEVEKLSFLGTNHISLGPREMLAGWPSAMRLETSKCGISMRADVSQTWSFPNPGSSLSFSRRATTF